MNVLPTRIYVYISAVSALAIVGWMVAPGSITWLPLIVFSLAYLVVEAFPVVKGEQEFISISGTIACLGASIMGPKFGMAAAVIGSVVASRYLRIQGVKSLYNAMQAALQVYVAWHVYRLVGGGQPDVIRDVVPFMLMYASFWFVNVVLISSLFAILERSSFFKYARQELRDFSLQLGLVMVINCTALATYHAFGLWAIALFVVVLLLVRYAMAAYNHARGFYIRIIQLLTGVMEAQDQFTHGHSERVAHYAVAVGRSIGLQSAKIDMLRTAALLHDVGKMKIPHDVLHKEGKLTPEEFELVKEHPVTGADWVGKLDTRGTLPLTIRHHHERWDGKGYPDGLAGNDIPELSRIISVVDAFDAMTSDRAYRRSMSAEQALRILEDNAGTQFDPRIVEAFIACADVAIRDVPQPSLAIVETRQSKSKKRVPPSMAAPAEAAMLAAAAATHPALPPDSADKPQRSPRDYLLAALDESTPGKPSRHR